MTDWAKYAKDREHLNYYKKVKEYILDLPCCDSIMDVGCGGTDVVLTGDFKNRTVVNKQKLNVEYPNTNVIIGDWLDVSVCEHEIVTCCQVLEHLETEKIKPFIDKLQEKSKYLIVSVPYLWKKGACRYHKQDPINKEKFFGWFGCESFQYEIVDDNGCKRIVALF